MKFLRCLYLYFLPKLFVANMKYEKMLTFFMLYFVRKFNILFDKINCKGLCPWILRQTLITDSEEPEWTRGFKDFV